MFQYRILGYGLFQDKPNSSTVRFSTFLAFRLWKTSIFYIFHSIGEIWGTLLIGFDNDKALEQTDNSGDLTGSDPQNEPVLENPFSYVRTRARIAIYDDLMSAPRIIDVEPAPVLEFIERIASTTYELAQNQGGSLPYSVIREIAENFIHALFTECTVSVLDKGNTICFSDQGPGIEKKRLVQQPGITSASSEMKRFIRGVGSGFPLVKEYLNYRNGYLSIDDNAQKGTVITLSVQPETPISRIPIRSSGEQPQSQQIAYDLDHRSLKVLHLLYEKGILGPSDLMDPLAVSAATAHRILNGLEKKGLIESTPHRKRILSSAGAAFLEADNPR
jgi:hypothetical protein